jgi:hypothetical protein
MRSIDLLCLVCLLPASLLGCTRDNPAFEDCDGPGRCPADESGDHPGDGDPGDGDPSTGDGDPSTGDGDPSTGDGDPSTGDGDPSTGDGDPTPMLPTCPETVFVERVAVKDTFLVFAPQTNDGCLTNWNYETDATEHGPFGTPCSELGFGGAEYLWVCDSGECKSRWLGRFNVGGFANANPVVVTAFAEFWARVETDAAITFTAHALAVGPDGFGAGCTDWNPGTGWGAPLGLCETSWAYMAHPTVWPQDAPINNDSQIGWEQITFSDGPAMHSFEIPLDVGPVQAWVSGEALHYGMVLTANAHSSKELLISSTQSDLTPVIKLQLCSEGE